MIDWRALPSLSSLRAYEAAARLRSHSAAARELNVTHAAIAQHVRQLEAHFGQSLLQRDGQGMTPTPEGAQLGAALTDGLTTIAQGCQALTDLKADRPLSLTCTPSFAERWLMPRMAAFWAHHPDIAVSITPSNTVVDLRRDGFDLAIRYGRGAWPGLEAAPLVNDGFCIVCAPQIAPNTTINSIHDLQSLPWLMDVHRAETHILSRDIGLDPETMTLRTFETNGMVISAARAGLGLALQARSLVAEDLRDRALVSVWDIAPENLGYYVATLPGPQSPRLKTLIRWLKGSA